ncbi:UDP-glucose dehydrogenase family protein [Leadbettera azotonutricia]|uniref:UDP-glucose 6-dehydrogenase n=1 Tax=Leadbettera azotonutricia (strain ATCC BAA-888 / DSM 13862 / ZAS-9) TaxID=545695 RepID=F5YAW1_LEAAZ|nr:UDP-glucose/GDP-mannose dehydrogenase family protein [Leadbettera azotonutricia]AEF81959.1 UDP-glucose 6-dehydrogenase [Leadbettera azotonutricia ZAS-9]
MINIAVIGTGYVGLVSGACLADFGNMVTCIDNNSEKIDILQRGEIPIYEPGLDLIVERNTKAGRLHFTTDFEAAVTANNVLFIAVGTPPADDGSADLRYVKEVARKIGQVIESYTVVVDKSTVPVGTARKVYGWIKDELLIRGKDIPFDVVSNPEFLREGSAVQDFTHPDRVVIGLENERSRKIMKDIYRSLYLNETPFIETNLESAEMIKYASNSFLALKITFINEIANLCEKVGANVQDVAKAVGRDGRIGSKFLHPGPGYGGSCFPKDTQAMAQIGKDYGEHLSLVETTIEANKRQKIRMIEKIESGMGRHGSLSGKTIAILGLAFKQNTDDMRESPAILICEGLASKGAKLKVWDPAAMKEALWRFESIKDYVYFARDEYDAIENADALVILTPWNQFRNLDLPRIKKLLALPYFFDLRNIYKRNEIEEIGLIYFAIGK